jgi:hypothetical protein
MTVNVFYMNRKKKDITIAHKHKQLISASADAIKYSKHSYCKPEKR